MVAGVSGFGGIAWYNYTYRDYKRILLRLSAAAWISRSLGAKGDKTSTGSVVWVAIELLVLRETFLGSTTLNSEP